MPNLSHSERTTIKLRGDIRRATEDLLRAASREYGIAFRNAETELQELAMRMDAPITDAEIRRWANHPDELVTIMFARLYGEHLEAEKALLKRAIRDAEREGVVWTPLLDVLSDVLRNSHLARQTGDFDDRIRALESWIKSTDDPEELRILSKFESHALRYLRLAKSKTIPESEIPNWVRSPIDAFHFIQNRQVIRRHAPAFFLHVLDLSLKEIRDLKRDIEGMPNNILSGTDATYADQFINRLLANWRERLWEIDDICATLIDRLPAINPKRILELLELEEVGFAKKLQASLTLHRCAPSSIDPWQLAMQRGFVFQLIEHPNAPANILQKAWTELGHDVAKDLLEHPNTPKGLAKIIVQSWNGWQEERMDLASFSHVALRPHIALEMLRTRPMASVARDIFDIYTDDENRSFQRMAQYAEVLDEAIRILIENDYFSRYDLEKIQELLERGVLALTQKTQTALLSHKDREVREWTITRLDKLQTPRPSHSIARGHRR